MALLPRRFDPFRIKFTKWITADFPLDKLDLEAERFDLSVQLDRIEAPFGRPELLYQLARLA
jgi:hypothetical protein